MIPSYRTINSITQSYVYTGIVTLVHSIRLINQKNQLFSYQLVVMSVTTLQEATRAVPYPVLYSHFSSPGSPGVHTQNSWGRT
mmetsp:Transcript_19488/g.19824  ORF Transcript_19488/g.19824 Transcript_19488/m.19824 type:complete len:83 (-) Transcript_19488:373-621(-)